MWTVSASTSTILEHPYLYIKCDWSIFYMYIRQLCKYIKIFKCKVDLYAVPWQATFERHGMAKVQPWTCLRLKKRFNFSCFTARITTFAYISMDLYRFIRPLFVCHQICEVCSAWVVTHPPFQKLPTHQTPLLRSGHGPEAKGLGSQAPGCHWPLWRWSWLL